MHDLMKVLREDLPNGKNNLLQASSDIERAADYCKNRYAIIPDKNLPNQPSKSQVLEETMSFATQSLGTIAYQINILASTFLGALDKQSELFDGLKETVDKLALNVDIHREKVARKAIGSSTVQKAQIIYSRDNQKPKVPPKYVRQPINYSILDNIGHGVRGGQEPTINQYAPPPTHTQTMQRRGSTSSHSGNAHTMGPKSGSEYATGRYQGGGTLGRTAGIHRTTVVPPQHLIGGSANNSPSIGPAITTTMSNVNQIGVSVPGTTASVGMPIGGMITQQIHGSSLVTNAGAGGQPQTPRLQQQVSMPTGKTVVGSYQTANQQQQMINLAQQQRQQNQLVRQQSEVALGQHQQQQQQQMAAIQQQQQVQLALQQKALAQQQAQAQAHQQQQQQQQIAMAQQQQQHRQQQQQQMAAIQAQQAIQQQQQAAVIQQQQQQALMQKEMETMSVNDLPPPPDLPDTSAMMAQQPTSPANVDITRLQPNPMEQFRPKQPDDPAWAPNAYLHKVVTVYKYTRDKDDELTFDEKQLIYVIKKNDDGWWEGVMNGITGLFPGNYVDLLD